MMTAKQILNGAAKRVEEVGWLQNGYAETTGGRACGVHWTSLRDGEEHGKACVAGSIRLSTGQLGVAENDKPAELAKEILRQHLGIENLADWNDDPSRTKEQVIAVLKAAAKKA